MGIVQVFVELWPNEVCNTSASTLSSLSKSGTTNNGRLVKIFFSCLNVSCCLSAYFHFSSFLVRLFRGQAIFAKFFTNHLSEPKIV